MGLNVLSLFDGISCGMVALERTGIELDRYVAYEINSNAIKVSEANYPQIEHHGNVLEENFSKYKGFDLLIGGSPCQDICPASCGAAKDKKKGLDGNKSGLFYEYIRVLDEVKPTYFLFENVGSMKKSDKDAITSYFEVDPILINSNLVSAQNRKRYYWTNIPNVEQPVDKNIKLSDVILAKNNVDKKWFHTDKAIALMNREVGKTGRIRLHNGQGVTFNGAVKSGTITANFRKGVPYNVFVYSENDMRRFTPEECEILQTLPVGYTSCIATTNRYECIGNGWTVDVIAHILRQLIRNL